MDKKIIIAGSGGQGILFLGKILVYTGMIDQKEVTWFPSYGAEMRGGTATCTVIVSDIMIGSPVVTIPDILVAMNKESLLRFQPCLRKNGLLFFDSSLIQHRDLNTRNIYPIPVPATVIAGRQGNTRAANMVMLGGIIATISLFRKSSVMKVLMDTASSDKVRSRMNINLFQEGMNYIDDQKS